MQIRMGGAGINTQKFKWVKNAWGCIMRMQRGFMQEVNLASCSQSGGCPTVRGKEGGRSEQGVA